MGNPQMNMLQIHNGHHHKQNFKQRMNASNNLHKKKLKSLDIKATTLPKLRLTLKKVYLTPTINNIILTTDNLSGYFKCGESITSIAIISKRESTIRLRGNCSSMRCDNTIPTQKPRWEH